jgi:hypothetical protein
LRTEQVQALGNRPLAIDEQPGAKAKRAVEPQYDLSQPAKRGRKVLQAPTCLNSTLPLGCSITGRRHMGPSGICYDRPLDGMMSGAPVSVWSCRLTAVPDCCAVIDGRACVPAPLPALTRCFLLLPRLQPPLDVTSTGAWVIRGTSTPARIRVRPSAALAAALLCSRPSSSWPAGRALSRCCAAALLRCCAAAVLLAGQGNTGFWSSPVVLPCCRGSTTSVSIMVRC